MLRTLFKSDIDQLLAIESAAHVAPWTEETFKICFQTGYMGWGLEVDKKIIGYIFVSFQMDECHILNVVVALAHQRQGWGRKLMEYAISRAKQRGSGIAYLEVRRSNTRAISLYRKMDFHLIGERKAYYPTHTDPEDALIFAKNLREEEF